jgi:hypothetical protein
MLVGFQADSWKPDDRRVFVTGVRYCEAFFRIA